MPQTDDNDSRPRNRRRLFASGAVTLVAALAALLYIDGAFSPGAAEPPHPSLIIEGD